MYVCMLSGVLILMLQQFGHFAFVCAMAFDLSHWLDHSLGLGFTHFFVVLGCLVFPDCCVSWGLILDSQVVCTFCG